MKEHREKPKQTDSSYESVITFLKKKQFGLANIGITHKMSFDWRAAGIYLQEKKTKYRMKYSSIEYVWLLFVKELRQFGLPIKSVLHLKDFLLTPINVEELLLAIQDEVDLEDEIVQLFGESAGVYNDSKKELKHDLSEVGQNIVDSMFNSMLVSTLTGEEDYFFLIKKDGSCLIESQNRLERSTLHVLNSFSDSSCLRIPLKMLVVEFLEKEGIQEYDLSNQDTLNSITQSLDFKSKENYGKVSPKIQFLINQLMTEEKLNEISYRTKEGKKVSISKTSKAK